MKLINREELFKYNGESFVWYACYGSNINYRRFMIYINGDKDEKFGNKIGCSDKTEPAEKRKYIFSNSIYFAGESKRWGGGMAFLDYENLGKAYGKIYKIKIKQFIDILEQEQTCKLYDAILLIDYIQDLPVFTFTAKNKLTELLNEPSSNYQNIIKEGILDLYKEIDPDDLKDYFKNK